MSRNSSVPSQPAAAGRYHFQNAVGILEHQPTPVKRSFEGSARDVMTLATRLSALLKEGTKLGAPLKNIDDCASEVMQKCLEIQQLTIKARRDGVR